MKTINIYNHTLQIDDYNRLIGFNGVDSLPFEVSDHKIDFENNDGTRTLKMTLHHLLGFGVMHEGNFYNVIGEDLETGELFLQELTAKQSINELN